MDIVPYGQKWYPIIKVSILTLRLIGKIGLVYKSANTVKKFLRNIDWKFCVLSDNVLGDTSWHYTHELSVTLSLVNFSSYSMCFWTNLKNSIIFHQIDFVANFPLYILIEGWSQTFLVISQFFQFFAEMPHISAERHLSKISF